MHRYYLLMFILYILVKCTSLGAVFLKLGPLGFQDALLKYTHCHISLSLIRLFAHFQGYNPYNSRNCAINQPRKQKYQSQHS